MAAQPAMTITSARRPAVMRALGRVVLLVVLVTVFTSDPAPALHGRGLAVLLVALAYGATLLVQTTQMAPRRPLPAVLALGSTAVALAALQPGGAPEVASSVAVWLVVQRLPSHPAIVLGGAITVGLAVVQAIHRAGVGDVVSSVLLCAALGVMARLMNDARAAQQQAEDLLAELHEAREAQLEAAAGAERGRIAGELHDVLAHSLSGLSIQLQGARALAAREGVSPELRATLERSGELAAEGFAEARQAVGALRGERLPTVGELPALVDRMRADLGIDVTLEVEGEPRDLAPEASLALYRGAQEALTNAARHAPGAPVSVVLRWNAGAVELDVRNVISGDVGAAAPLAGVGGGNGLAGMRERAARAGGEMRAGPTGDGFLVSVRVPV